MRYQTRKTWPNQEGYSIRRVFRDIAAAIRCRLDPLLTGAWVLVRHAFVVIVLTAVGAVVVSLVLRAMLPEQLDITIRVVGTPFRPTMLVAPALQLIIWWWRRQDRREPPPSTVVV